MKVLSFFFLGISLSGGMRAQSENPIPDNVRAANAIDAFQNHNGASTPGLMLYGIPGALGTISGNSYLNDGEWRKTTLKIVGHEGELSNYQCRANLYSHEIEVKFDGSIKVINGPRVKEFWMQRNGNGDKAHYCNASNYKIDNVPQVGFLEVLVEGKIRLLKKNSVIIKRPDYNVQLDVGSKDTRIIKEETLYITKAEELLEVRSVKKRNFASIFDSLSTEMNKFISDRSLKISNEEDLITIFSYYNEKAK